MWLPLKHSTGNTKSRTGRDITALTTSLALFHPLHLSLSHQLQTLETIFFVCACVQTKTMVIEHQRPGQ